MQRFTDDTYSNFNHPTVGVEFAVRTIQMNDFFIRLQIWDTAGQEEYKSIARSYYRASAGILLCFDITCRESFKGVQKWLEEAKQYGNPRMSFILVGCKSDLDHKRKVSRVEAGDLASYNQMNYIETSSFTAHNVDKCFNEITFEIYQKILQGEIDVDLEGTEGVKHGRDNKLGTPNKKNIKLTQEKKNSVCDTKTCC